MCDAYVNPGQKGEGRVRGEGQYKVMIGEGKVRMRRSYTKYL